MPQIAETFIQIIAFDLYAKATRTGSLSSLYTIPSSTETLMILSSLYKPLEMLTDILKYLDNKRISKPMWRLCLLISLLELTTLKEKMESVAPSKSAIVLGFRDFLPLVSCHHISHNHYALQ